jgi:protein-S-isoprenylcysteine O-methyltransferase Ste14
LWTSAYFLRWLSLRACIGAAIALPAFYFWMLARHQLGESFAVRAKAKKLVTHGLYSKIRNPIYLFGGLGALGHVFDSGLVRMDGHLRLH